MTPEKWALVTSALTEAQDNASLERMTAELSDDPQWHQRDIEAAKRRCEVWAEIAASVEELTHA